MHFVHAVTLHVIEISKFGRGHDDIVAEFRSRGARVWVAAPGASGTDALPLPNNIAPIVTPLLAVQSFYRAASALALARGYDPDVPPHLNKVTETV